MTGQWPTSDSGGELRHSFYTLFTNNALTATYSITGAEVGLRQSDGAVVLLVYLGATTSGVDTSGSYACSITNVSSPTAFEADWIICDPPSWAYSVVYGTQAGTKVVGDYLLYPNSNVSSDWVGSLFTSGTGTLGFHQKFTTPVYRGNWYASKRWGRWWRARYRLN